MRSPGRALAISRVLTVKLAPDDAQWKRMRELAWQAMQYRNQFVRARWAEMAGLCVNPAKGDGHDVSKHIRSREKGELSAAVYASLEREVQAVISRDGKKLLAGAPLPQWRQADSLSVRGSGVGNLDKFAAYAHIAERDGKFFADLPLQNKDCEGGCHIVVPLAGGTEIDDYQAPLLRAMAEKKIVVGKMVVCFNVKRGRTLLRIAYHTERYLPPMGERVATLGPRTKDGRLVLRTETQTIDYTARLATVIARGDQWDAIRRRVACQIGRRKGGSRAKRRKFLRLSPDDWLQNYLHQWSRELIGWCVTQGVGRLVVLDLGAGCWPAYRFAQYLKYKGEDEGMTVEGAEAASLADASTDRAATNETKKRQRKAKKVVEAVRTLASAVGE